MVKEIRVENFKGIAKERKISFVANSKRIKSKDGVYKTVSGEILLAVGLMGKNASGKTSFLEAIAFLQNLAYGFLYDSEYRRIKHNYEDHEKTKKVITCEDVMASIKEAYFLNKDKKLKVGIIFVDQKNVVAWNIALASGGEVLETIHYNKEQVFKNIARIDKFKTKIFAKDLDFKRVVFFQYSRMTLMPQRFLRKSASYDPKIAKKISKDYLLDWLRIADDKIIDFNYDSKNKYINGYFIKHGEKNYKISWLELSEGTQKWMLLGIRIFKALLQKQHFIFVDGIETSFHPWLTKFIISLFNNKTINKMRSQILFTSHSPIVVDRPFRKDAIYYFDDQEVINLGNDLNIREDRSITKNFLSDSLGSHPSKVDMFDFLEQL